MPYGFALKEPRLEGNDMSFLLRLFLKKVYSQYEATLCHFDFAQVAQLKML